MILVASTGPNKPLWLAGFLCGVSRCHRWRDTTPAAAIGTIARGPAGGVFEAAVRDALAPAHHRQDLASCRQLHQKIRQRAQVAPTNGFRHRPVDLCRRWWLVLH